MLGYYLDVSKPQIDAIVQNKKEDMREALYQMLSSWRKNKEYHEEPYVSLWKALTHADVSLSSIAIEVLDPPSFFLEVFKYSTAVRRFSLIILK